MAYLNVADNLNFVVKGFKEELKFNTKFIQGDLLDSISALSKSLVPYGKIGLIAYNDTFMAIGKELVAKLKELGLKTVAMVFKHGSDDTVKSASQLFNFPEDVRLVISFDSGLYRISAYYANVKGVPVICGLKNFETRGICDRVIFLRNGKTVDKIPVNPERYVIIDEKLFSKENVVSDAYAFIMSKAVALIDYRMKHVNNGTTASQYIFGLLKEAVTETLGLDNYSLEEKNIILIKNALLINLANALSNGDLYDASAETVVSRLLFRFKSYIDYGTLLFSAIKILGIYNVYFNCKSSALLNYIDYNERVDLLVNLFGLGENQVLDGIKKQLELVKKGRSRSEGEKFKLKKEVATLYKLTEKMSKTFISLGGKGLGTEDKARFIAALKVCGDTPYGLNTMSLVRESGVTEFI